MKIRLRSACGCRTARRTPDTGTSDRAALQLEAIGKDAIPLLQVALKSPLLEVRFHAATALAYLEDPAGLKTLQEAARDERAFRVFALAAMSTVDEAESHLLLRELMNENSAETRYGAFRALWTLDRNDPFIRGELMSRPETDKSDKQELTNRKNARLGPCTCCRPRAIRWSTRRSARGPKSYCTDPIRNGHTPDIVRWSQCDDHGASRRAESLRRAIPAKSGRRTPRSFAECRRSDSRLRRTRRNYPDVVSMLTQASEQRNLEGRLESDALPQSGRVYARPSQDSKPGKKAKVGREHLAPNIFPRAEEDSQFKAATACRPNRRHARRRHGEHHRTERTQRQR